MSDSHSGPIEFDDYTFFPNRDSFGMDMYHITTSDEESILKLKEQADLESNCVAFNTYGFLKYNIHKTDKFIYLQTVHSFTDGIYVKKQHIKKLVNQDIVESAKNSKKKYTVKLICCWSQNLADGWNFMNPEDSSIKFVSGKDIHADYYVIVNSVTFGEYYVPERTIIFHMEPSFVFANLGGEWGNPDESKFLKVLSHKNGYNNVEWHISKHIDVLRFESKESIIKTKDLSTVLSNAYFHKGHKLRVDFTKFLDNCDLSIDVYGKCSEFNFKNYKGELPPCQKDDALFPYKYSIAVENNSEYNYFTEKVTDCILAECLCFYWGAPNLEDYYPDAFIRLDLSDFNKGLEQIKAAIENNEWEKRLPAIRAAKYKILYDMHLTKRLERIIREVEIIPTYDDQVINLDYKLPIVPLSIKTVCINLLRRPDRKETQIERFNEVNIKDYSFIEAVDGKKLHKNKQLMSLFAKCDFNYSVQVMGCALSHIQLWLELIEDKDNDVYCVFEDDAYFSDKFTELYPEILKQLSSPLLDWDLVYLGLGEVNNKNYRKYDTEINIKSINRNLNCYGTVGYLINKKGAIKSINYIRKNGMTKPIDTYINYSIQDLNVMEVNPHIVYQPLYVEDVITDSNISTDYYVKLTD